MTLSEVIDGLETVAWAVIADVDPDDQEELRAELRALARDRDWRVRSVYRPDFRLVSIVRPAPAPETTRRARRLR